MLTGTSDANTPLTAFIDRKGRGAVSGAAALDPLSVCLTDHYLINIILFVSTPTPVLSL